MKKKVQGKLLTLGLGVLLMVSVVPSMGTAETESEDTSFILGLPGVSISWLSTLDPVAWQMGAEFAIHSVVAEHLADYRYVSDDSDAVELVPRLATSWEYTDSVTLVVNLREGVTFTDGTPMNATTIKWNWDRIMNLATNYRWQMTVAMMYWMDSDVFRAVEGVDLDWLPAGEMVLCLNNTEVISEYVLQFNLNIPFDFTEIAFPSSGMMSPIAHADFFNAIMLQDNSAGGPTVANWTWDQGLVGTGPYKFIGKDDAAEEVRMQVNPDWWGERPSITNYTMKYFTDAAAATTALIAGDIDGVASPDLDMLEGASDANITLNSNPPQLSAIYIAMYETVDIAVREALNYALDSQYFIDEVYDGHGANSTGALFPGQTYQNDAVNPPAYDLAYARQVMIDAGLTAGSGLDASSSDDEWRAVADGTTPLDSYTLGYIPFSQDWVVVVKDAARNIGVNLTLALQDDAIFWDSLWNKTACQEDWDMYTSAMGLWPNAESTFLLMWIPGAFFSESVPDEGDTEITGWINAFLATDPTETSTRQEYADLIVDKMNNELYYFLWLPVEYSNFGMTEEWDWSHAYLFFPEEVRLVGEDRSTDGGNQIPGYSLFSLTFASFLAIAVFAQRKFTSKKK